MSTLIERALAALASERATETERLAAMRERVTNEAVGQLQGLTDRILGLRPNMRDAVVLPLGGHDTQPNATIEIDGLLLCASYTYRKISRETGISEYSLYLAQACPKCGDVLLTKRLESLVDLGAGIEAAVAHGDSCCAACVEGDDDE